MTKMSKYTIKGIFYLYLIYICFSYVRPINISVQRVADVISDYSIHFIAFFILGLLAQLANTKNNEFIFGISLSLIVSLFIEFTHFIIPYRYFSVGEIISNVLGCIIGIYVLKLLNYIYEKIVN